MTEQVRAGLAQSGFGQRTILQRAHEPAQPGEWPGKVFLPECGAFFADLLVVPLRFELI